MPWLMCVVLVLLKACWETGNIFLQYILDGPVNLMGRNWVEEHNGERCCACPYCFSTKWVYDRTEAIKKEFKSIFGVVVLFRHPAECVCGQYFYPLDSILGLGGHKMFPFLQTCCIQLGTHLSDRVASQFLVLLTGVYVCPNTIRDRIEEMGKAVIDRWDGLSVLEVEKLVEVAAGAKSWIDLHFSIDGLFVHENKKRKGEEGSHKEAKIATFSLRDRFGNVLEKIVVSRMKAPEDFLFHVYFLLVQLQECLPNLRKTFAHADGAPWIQKFIERTEFMQFILDWYHLMKKLGELPNAFGKKWTPYREGVFQQVKNHLWHGNVNMAVSVLQGLRLHTEKLKSVRENIVNYIEERKDYIPNYKWLKERAFVIGSGEIEGAVKHVVSDRLKLSGMRWSIPGADCRITARCSVLNETSIEDMMLANIQSSHKQKKSSERDLGTEEAAA